MKAAILDQPRYAGGLFLQVKDVLRPQLQAGHVLLRVVAGGVCRTDLHVAEGDLPKIQKSLILGRQLLGEAVDGPPIELPPVNPPRGFLDGRRRLEEPTGGGLIHADRLTQELEANNPNLCLVCCDHFFCSV